MAITLPRVLQGVNILVDGTSKLGVAVEMTLPVIETDTEEVKVGGMDAPIDHDKGLKPLNGDFTLADYDEDVLSKFGVGEKVSVTFRTSSERLGDSSDVVAIKGEIEGTFKKVDMGTWGESKRAAVKYEWNASYFKLTVGTKEIYEIDIPGMKRVINGVDQLAARRTALGL